LRLPCVVHYRGFPDIEGLPACPGPAKKCYRVLLILNKIELVVEQATVESVFQLRPAVDDAYLTGKPPAASVEQDQHRKSGIENPAGFSQIDYKVAGNIALRANKGLHKNIVKPKIEILTNMDGDHMAFPVHLQVSQVNPAGCR
jgi:hypothetical protein